MSKTDADPTDAEREASFLAAIQRDPNDEASRLVYADWLEERGDERAEYVRLENLMWKGPPRLAQLQRKLDPNWLMAVSRWVDVVLISTPLKINAIKLVRELKGLGLKEAKDIVDAMPSVVMAAVAFDEGQFLRARFINECKAVVELRPTRPQT